MPSIPVPIAHQPMNRAAYDRYQEANHQRAQYNLPQRLAVLEHFKQQLIQYTGKNFPVVPDFYEGTRAQNGAAFIAFEELGKPDLSLLFWLAHEWGHLSHADQQCRFRTVPADIIEQQADIFAATFMKRHGYSIHPILEDLKLMPDLPVPDEHGIVADRMQIIHDAYIGEPRQYPPQFAQPDPKKAVPLLQPIAPLVYYSPPMMQPMMRPPIMPQQHLTFRPFARL